MKWFKLNILSFFLPNVCVGLVKVYYYNLITINIAFFWVFFFPHARLILIIIIKKKN